MVRLYLNHYIGNLGYQENEVFSSNFRIGENQPFIGSEKDRNITNFKLKQSFVKQNLNIDICKSYENKYYFRIDHDTCKIFYPYSRIIFEFDEDNYIKDNSNMKCIIEYNQYALIDVKDLDTINYDSREFIKTLNLIQGGVNSSTKKFIDKCGQSYCKNIEYTPVCANFDFKFTTNDSDIDIFLPYVEILMEFIFRERIHTHLGGDSGIMRPFIEEDYFTNSIKKVIEQNLIKKKKAHKRMINLEDTLEDLKTLKKNTEPIIYKYLADHNTLTESLRKWFLGLSRTLTNVLVEHHFSKMIVNYTPHQEKKNNLVYKRS